MINRILLSLTLFLTLITVFPSATAFAQEGQEVFLPTVYGYVAPPEPPVTGPTPFDVNPHDLIIVPADIPDYDYEVTQDEVVALTDGLRNAGVVRGYITFMENEEEDIRKGPFVVGSYALVFMNEEQAQAYYDAVKQRLIDIGLSEYWNAPARVVYVERENIQGFHILYSDAVGREGNVIVYTYSVDQEGARHPSSYIDWMLKKLLNGRSSASGTATSQEPEVPAESSTGPETFKVIIP